MISQDQSDISECIYDSTLLSKAFTGCLLPREKSLHSVAPQILPQAGLTCLCDDTQVFPIIPTI